MKRLEIVERILEEHKNIAENIKQRYSEDPAELTELNNKIEEEKTIAEEITKNLNGILTNTDTTTMNSAEISKAMKTYNEALATARRNQREAELKRDNFLKDNGENKDYKRAKELLENDTKTKDLLNEELKKLEKDVENIKEGRKIIAEQEKGMYEIVQIPQEDGSYREEKMITNSKKFELVKKLTERLNTQEKDVNDALELCKDKLKEFENLKDSLKQAEKIEDFEEEQIEDDNISKKLEANKNIEETEKEEDSNKSIANEQKENKAKVDMNTRPLFAPAQTQPRSGKAVTIQQAEETKEAEEPQEVQETEKTENNEKPFVSPIIQPAYDEADLELEEVKRDSKIKITYNAKTDTYLIRDLKTKQVQVYSRRDLAPLSREELGQNISTRLEGLENVDMNILKILTDYDKDKRYAYYDIMRQQTMIKNKSEVVKLMRAAKIQIEYDLDGLYSKGSEISVKDRQEILNVSNIAHKIGVATVKKNLKVRLLELVEKKFMLNRKEKMLAAPAERAFEDKREIKEESNQKEQEQEKKIIIPHETRDRRQKSEYMDSQIKPLIEMQNSQEMNNNRNIQNQSLVALKNAMREKKEIELNNKVDRELRKYPRRTNEVVEDPTNKIQKTKDGTTQQQRYDNREYMKKVWEVAEKEIEARDLENQANQDQQKNLDEK